MSRLSPTSKRWILAGGIAALAVVPLLAWGIAVGLRDREPPPSEESSPSSSSDVSKEESQIELEPVSDDALNILVCGLDDAAGLTDVIVVVNFDVRAGKINALQIPRDTYIGDNYKTGKINQVYFTHRNDDEPIRGLIGVIEEQLRLPIDHYVTITLQGFRDMVDALGGVEIDVPQRIEFLPGKVIEPGKQHLNGEQAEWFVRYRAGYPTGDIGRINAQKLMIDALVQAVRDKGRTKMLLLATQNFDKITTDLPLTRALSLANEAFSVENQNIQIFTVEGSGKMHNGFAVYEANRAQLTELLNTYFRPYGQAVDYLPIPSVPAPPPYQEETETPPNPDGLVEEPESSEEGELKEFPID